MTKKYDIEVDCANCAAKAEDAANKVDGVKKATINFMMQKMTVEFDDDCDTKKVIKNILKDCRKIESDFEIDM